MEELGVEGNELSMKVDARLMVDIPVASISMWQVCSTPPVVPPQVRYD